MDEKGSEECVEGTMMELPELEKNESPYEMLTDFYRTLGWYEGKDVDVTRVKVHKEDDIEMMKKIIQYTNTPKKKVMYMFLRYGPSVADPNVPRGKVKLKDGWLV